MRSRRWLIVLLISFAFTGLLLTSCGGGGGGGGDDDDTDDDTDDDVADDNPPEFDGASGAEAVDYHTIRVFWDAASDDHTDADGLIYSVYAAEADGDFDFSDAASTSTIGKTYALVNLLKPSTEYKFVVRATDLSGNQEENEVEVSATTDDVPEPVCGGLGGMVDKNGIIYAKVVDENCNPIEDALVWLGSGGDYAFTDASGEAQLPVGGRGTTVTVSAAKDGYTSMTFFDVPTEQTNRTVFNLEPYPPTDADTYLSCGTMDTSTTGDLPQADDIIQDLTIAGFVVESLTKRTLLEFDLNSLLGPNIPFEIPGIGAVDIPSNIWVPEVSAFGVSIEIDPFFVPLRGSSDKPHTVFALTGTAYLSDILAEIGEEVDIAAVIALITPQKGGVIRSEEFEEGDPDNPLATFELPLDYAFVDLSNGPTINPDDMLYPVEGYIYDLPTNVANPTIISLLGGDLGDDGLIAFGVGSGEYPTLTGAPATGDIDDVEFIALSIAAVADRDSPYIDAFSNVLSAPDFGGGEQGAVLFEGFLNFTLLHSDYGCRNYGWDDVTNGDSAPGLALLNWMDADRNLVWKGYYPDPTGDRTSVTVPTLPTKVKVADMHANIHRFQALLAQHAWFDYAAFPVELFEDLVIKVSGKEKGV